MNLSKKAEELYQEMLEPLMIAINYDAQMSFGKFYEKDELFRMAVALHLYAINQGKVISIDPETKLLIIK